MITPSIRHRKSAAPSGRRGVFGGPPLGWPWLVLALTVACGVAVADPAGGPPSLTHIPDEVTFRAMAVANEGDHYLKFLLDRHENRMDYLNGHVYRYHYDFAVTRFPNLSPEAFNNQTYFSPGRRFIAGTIAWRTVLAIHTFELWEGDTATPDLLLLAQKKLEETWFTKGFVFHPTSPAQEALTPELAKRGIKIVTSDEIYANVSFKVFNPGTAVGKVRIATASESGGDALLDPFEIALIDYIPSDITPVAGIIATKFSTPLSHMNLRAYAWKIPNVVVPDAMAKYGKFAGRWVFLRADTAGLEVREATAREIEEARKNRPRPRRVRLPADRNFKELADLGTFGKGDADRFGSKAANLAELARRGGVRVPRGFTIPFYWYDRFARKHGIDKRVTRTLSQTRFKEDAPYRKQRLEEIKAAILNAPHLDEFRKVFLAKIHQEYEGKGVFVRSSTNSEDLKGFNGAGLYDSVPNVKGDDPLLAAVKVVWASVFNFKAYQEREHYGIDHLTVCPAVLVVETAPAQAAGVLVTTDIYSADWPDSITINAKKGLGIKVVDGKSIPEQIIYNPLLDSIKVISRSEDTTEIVIKPDGGVEERPIEGRKPVLSDADVRLVAVAAQRVREVFAAEGVQDVEWVIGGEGRGRVVTIVQSRPYLGGGPATRPPGADGRAGLIAPPVIDPVPRPPPAERIPAGPPARRPRAR